jgi:hypothetical protein
MKRLAPMTEDQKLSTLEIKSQKTLKGMMRLLLTLWVAAYWSTCLCGGIAVPE